MHSNHTSSSPAAIVTGASRGIGRAIAEQLALDGYGIIVNYHARADAAADVVRAIESRGGRACAAQADISRLDDHERLVQVALGNFGRIEVLVNNAGISSPGRRDILETTPDAWDQVLATNLKGPFFLAQRVARQMLEQRQQPPIDRATIVNISSISAYTASLNRPDYCIAKAGLQMMTLLFAARLAASQIRVFEIRPGIIASDMTAPVQADYDRRIAAGLTPIARWGQPEDVARAVSMVVGNSLMFSTGETINVDGGFHIRRL
jgi:NAD(P)-dependent dehydrogenase (short-subunit alcohol dehydrogenase family)